MFLQFLRKITNYIYYEDELHTVERDHILFRTDWKGDRFLLLAMARNFLALLD